MVTVTVEHETENDFKEELFYEVQKNLFLTEQLLQGNVTLKGICQLKKPFYVLTIKRSKYYLGLDWQKIKT